MTIKIEESSRPRRRKRPTKPVKAPPASDRGSARAPIRPAVDPLQPQRRKNRRRKTEKAQHEVGYGKPPVEHQFKKGQSGNPNGRPRKLKPKPVDHPDAVSERLTAALARKTRVKMDGETREVTLFDAIIFRIVNDAAMGKDRAIKHVLFLRNEAIDRSANSEKEMSPAGRALLEEALAAYGSPDTDTSKEED
ncbi:MAG: DUF5681 domain-containing protein [Hyphomicrobiales bacterium]